MTKNNEEKAKKITDRIFESGFNTNRTFYDMAKNAAMEMARWKDEQFKAEKQALIDKACEWWENELTYPTMTKADMFYKESMIEEFKQAMKGGEQ